MEQQHDEISTGSVGLYFGFSMTAEFITNRLGVPASKKVKSASYWTKAEVAQIGRNLIDFLKTKLEGGYVDVPKPETKKEAAAALAAAQASAGGVASFDDVPVVGSTPEPVADPFSFDAEPAPAAATPAEADPFSFDDTPAPAASTDPFSFD